MAIRFVPWLPFCLILMLGLINACGHKNEAGRDYIVGHWGHLTSVSDSWAKPSFLINHPKDTNYNVCLDKYMSQSLPGIEQEIDASINIWAHYLGRKINVVFHSVELEQHYDYSETIHEYTKRNWSRCPRGTNIVVGLAYQDPSIGVTGFNSNKQRGLYLKLADDAQEEGAEEFHWQTFKQATGTEKNAKELLEMLISRNQSHSVKPDKTHMTLGVLMHEFGHVWGLCDQYALNDQDRVTNCDPKFASINGQGHIILNENAQMSAAKRYVRLFLTDDDIKGIQTFFDRAGYTPAGFPDQVSLAPTATPVSLPMIENFEIGTVTRFGSEIKAEFFVKTGKKVNYFASLIDKDGTSMDFSEYVDAGPLNWSPMIYTLRVNGGTHSLSKIKLTIKIPKEDGDFEIVTKEAPIPETIERNVIVIR